MEHGIQAPQGPLQYGLIAEEVAKVYPELVTRNAKGEIEGVRYDELAPLLLNEIQHQQQKQIRQQQEIAALQAQNEQLQAALAQQNETIMARLAQLEAPAARTATLASR